MALQAAGSAEPEELLLEELQVFKVSGLMEGNPVSGVEAGEREARVSLGRAESAGAYAAIEVLPMLQEE